MPLCRLTTPGRSPWRSLKGPLKASLEGQEELNARRDVTIPIVVHWLFLPGSCETALPPALLSARQNLMVGKPSMSTPSTSFAVASILAILKSYRAAGWLVPACKKVYI